MKKGFTITELLTILIILGIIALIAVPNINSIVKESKIKSYTTSSKTIIRTMKESCEANKISKEKPVLSYFFNNGKASSKIEFKGISPDSGYVILNNKCEIDAYYLVYDDYTYKNKEDIRQDYMLKKSTSDETSIFKTLYSSYYDSIINVYFIDNVNIPNNAIEIKDPSVSGNNKIKSWLIPNGEYYYDLYVGSDSTIFLNTNSAYLFYQSHVINYYFENINTILAEDMGFMFGNNFYLENIDVSNFNTANVKSFYGMFLSCNKINLVGIEKWDTSSATTMNHMFCNAFAIKNLDLSRWDTSNVTDMDYMFAANNESNTYMNLMSLDLSNWDMSKVTNMAYMFKLTYYLDEITVTNSNIIEKIDDFLLLRSTEYPGKIYFSGDTSDLDISILSSKNWHII